MGQINKIPLGYLNMLGSQTGGKNPFDASEIVVPSQEMTPFYHAQGMKVMNVSFTPIANNETQFMEVPANESWFVYSIANQVTTQHIADKVRWVNRISELPKSVTPHPVHVDAVDLVAAPTFSLLASYENFATPIPLTAGAMISQNIVDFAFASGSLPHQLTVMAAVFSS